MKQQIARLLDWFEDHFNYFIELIAFIGGVFCIVFSIFIFIALVFFPPFLQNSDMSYVFIPGIIGFLGVIILLALRITRHLTK